MSISDVSSELESITPTPSTLSLPPSVPSPTPVSSAKSQVTVSRTPSSVSTSSSISMRSSVFYPHSLFEEPLEPEQDFDDISTEPSLLSTAMSSVSSVSSPALPVPTVSYYILTYINDSNYCSDFATRYRLTRVSRSFIRELVSERVHTARRYPLYQG